MGGGNYSLTFRLADETLGRDCLRVCSLGIGEASQHGKLGRELRMDRHSGNRMNYYKPAMIHYSERKESEMPEITACSGDLSCFC